MVETYRAGPHFGEEPVISGTRGSGTIFFSRCTMRCLYCQNYRWSQEGQGTPCDAQRLHEIFMGLYQAGCHNWNLVSPTPWLPLLADVVARLKQHGISLPLVYNTGGFERTATLEAYAGLADIFLVDLRYADERSAWEGSGVRGYVATARAALKQMWRQAGPLVLDPDGLAASGVVCRLLILPGHAEEAVANLRWLAETLGTDVAISVMSQYVPAHRAVGQGRNRHWARRIDKQEYDTVVTEVERLGFGHGWIQGFDATQTDDFAGYLMTPDPEA